MGRFNLLINSKSKSSNVHLEIIDMLAGQQALGGPRSALVQIMHSQFAKVTTGSRFNMSVTSSVLYCPRHTSTASPC